MDKIFEIHAPRPHLVWSDNFANGRSYEAVSLSVLSELSLGQNRQQVLTYLALNIDEVCLGKKTSSIFQTNPVYSVRITTAV